MRRATEPGFDDLQGVDEALIGVMDAVKILVSFFNWPEERWSSGQSGCW